MFKQFSSKTTAAAWMAAVTIFAALVSSSTPSAQQAPAAGAAGQAAPARGRGPAPTDTLGAGPWDVGSGRGRVHVTAIKGLDHPWGIAFLPDAPGSRSEEHTSELQSQSNLVCRLLL